MAILLFLFLFLSRYGEAGRESDKEKRSGLQLLVATSKHMKKPYQLLIIPLTIGSGVEQAYFASDFTAVIIFFCFILDLYKNENFVYRIEFVKTYLQNAIDFLYFRAMFHVLGMYLILDMFLYAMAFLMQFVPSVLGV